MTKRQNGDARGHSRSTATPAFAMPAIHRRDMLALGAGGVLAASG